jgi:hypothetical protein
MVWLDYNTLRFPGLYFEQIDHLPYPQAQVGYYRWMYDKDPGHQLAALGPVPTPACKGCDPSCVPNGDAPFEYQVPHPAGIPGQTETLWGTKLPEPINVRPNPMDSGSAGIKPGSTVPPLSEFVPIAPTTPAPAKVPSDPPRIPSPSAAPPTKDFAPPPRIDRAPSLPKPIDTDAPPTLGPASEANPDVHVTSGSGNSSAPAPAADARWPR